MPCQDFPFPMRRAGSADVSVTSHGLLLVVIGPSGGYSGQGPGRIDLTMSYLAAGDYVLRLIDTSPGNVPQPFTMTLIGRD